MGFSPSFFLARFRRAKLQHVLGGLKSTPHARNQAAETDG
jgi:hypothetical protein